MAHKKNPAAVTLGNITKQRHGTKHYKKIGKKGGRPRQFLPCESPLKPSNPKHRFNPTTLVCYGCGRTADEVRIPGKITE
jgi:hypothetical protein